MAAIQMSNPYYTSTGQLRTAPPVAQQQHLTPPITDDGFGLVDQVNEPYVEGVSYRMLMSGLPDHGVTSEEVLEIFQSTVRRVKAARILHDEEGASVGVALITLYRAIDCVVAHEHFDGKLFDGKQKITLRPILDLTRPIPPALATLIAPLIPLESYPVSVPIPASRNRFTAAPTPTSARSQIITQIPTAPEPTIVSLRGTAAQSSDQVLDTDADFIDLSGSDGLAAVDPRRRGQIPQAGRGAQVVNGKQGRSKDDRARSPQRSGRPDSQRAPYTGRQPSRQAREMSHPYHKPAAVPGQAQTTHGSANGKGKGVSNGIQSGPTRNSVSILDRIEGASTFAGKNGHQHDANKFEGGAGTNGGKSLLNRMNVTLADRLRAVRRMGRELSATLRGMPARGGTKGSARMDIGLRTAAGNQGFGTGDAALARRFNDDSSRPHRSFNSAERPQKQSPNHVNGDRQRFPARPVQAVQTTSKSDGTRANPKKTQEQLDREMELYNRRKKFGGDAMDTA